MTARGRAVGVLLAVMTILASPLTAAARQGVVVEVLPKKPPKAPRPAAVSPPAAAPEPLEAEGLQGGPDDPDEPITTEPALRPQPGPLTPASYAAAFARVKSCDALAAGIADIPDATPLLAPLKAMAKGEFETTPEFVARYRQALRDSVGGAPFIVLKAPAPAYAMTYNADRRILSVSLNQVEGLLRSAGGCGRAYCSSGVEWAIAEKPYLYGELAFSLDRDTARGLKEGSTAILALSTDRVEIAPGSGQSFKASFAGRCLMLANAAGARRPDDGAWFNVAGPSGAAAAAGWFVVSDRDLGFSGELPASPEQGREPGRVDGPAEVVRYTAAGTDGAYVFVISDYRGRPVTADGVALIDETLSRVIKGVNARETGRVTTTVSGAPARLVNFEAKTQGVNLSGRVLSVWRDGRIYSALAIWQRGKSDDTAERVLASLKLDGP